MKSKRILSLVIAAVLLTAALWINTGVSATDDTGVKVKITPTYTEDVTLLQEDGKDTYKFKVSEGVSPVINFDYALEANTSYAITFDYKQPRATVWATPLYIGLETVFDKSGDAVSSDAAIKHRLKEFGGDLPAADDWTSKSIMFETGDLADESYKYLSIKGSTDLRPYIEMCNFEIVKLNKPAFAPTRFADVSENVDKNGEYSYAIKTSEYANPIMNFNYVLEPNTAYALTFEYKRPAPTWWTESLYIGLDKAYDKVGEDSVSDSAKAHRLKEIITSLGKTDTWTEKGIIFETGDSVDDEYKYLALKGKTGGVSNLEFRNFAIRKVKKPELSPSYIGDVTEYLGESDDCIYGIKKSEYAIPMMNFNYVLEPDKTYKLSFEYKYPKGTWWAHFLYVGLEESPDKFGTTANNEISLAHKLKDLEESMEVSTGWSEVIVTFSTKDIADGNFKYLSIKGQTGGAAELEMRNFKIVETDPIPDVLPYATTQSNWTNETFRNKRYLAKSGKNLIDDRSLENGGGNLATLFESGVMSITDATAREGINSLMFNATGLSQKKWSFATFEVEPNTEYYFTMWVKGEKWSATNKNDMRFGFIDPATGKFLKNNKGKNDGVNIVSWDGEWHLMIISFMNGSGTSATLGFYGKNSVAYFDCMELFKASDRELYKPAVYTMKSPYDYSSVVEKSSCNDEDNILQNYNFDDSENTFWQTGEGYGLTAEIVDTESSRGKALFYKENSEYTGYALQTSYIKWIDGLKKNTEYTFSAEYLITKAGNGYFGLIDGNRYYPREMWKFGFGEEEFDSDCKWQNAVIKFNTGDYDRIGIVVCGKGGGAYMDNIRLFESDKGILPTADTFPNKLESSTYTVKDKMIGGVSAGTTVAQLVAKFENNRYIRAFDASGKEITDWNNAVGTGTQIRLMDGISVLDKADVIIAGDSDGNGKCDAGDIGVLLKHLAKKNELTQLQKKAFDVDGNGIVDVNDLALLSLHLTGIKKLNTIVL